MARSTFNIAQAKGTPKPAKTADTTEIAARYFVYKLFDATAGQPMRWATLRGMDEAQATVTRAIERGWVILATHCRSGRGWQTVGTQGRVNRRRAAAGAQGEIE